MSLALAGKGVVIRTQRLEPEVDVRTGLFDALDPMTTPDDTAGHT